MKKVSIVLIITFFSTISFALPSKVFLPVPFLCQAPFGNWKQPWQDACEEAAVLMAIHYVRNYPLDKESGNQEILGMVKYQEKRWGGHHDLTAKQTAKLVKEYYRYNKIRVFYDIRVEDIKKELAAGNVVITPMAGRLLGNPYYTPPGPAYHYMLFKGYDDEKGEFITNDAGTKRGRDYRYKYKVVYNAIHDWTGDKETIAQGRKAMIIFEK
jgi:hypothetical protein